VASSLISLAEVTSSYDSGVPYVGESAVWSSMPAIRERPHTVTGLAIGLLTPDRNSYEPDLLNYAGGVPGRRSARHCSRRDMFCVSFT